MDWKSLHQSHYSTKPKTWDSHYSTWESLFLFDGFKDADVLEAMEEMVKVVPGPAIPDGHFEWLQKFLVSARDNLRRKHEAKRLQERAQRDCQDCRGVGIVCGLPDPECCKHGQWEPRPTWVDYTTISAYCSCPHGLNRHAAVLRWFQEHRRDCGEPLNLLQYERLVPDWRQQLKARADKVQAERSLRNLPAPGGRKATRGGKPGTPPGAGKPSEWVAIEAPADEPQPGEGAPIPAPQFIRRRAK